MDSTAQSAGHVDRDDRIAAGGDTPIRGHKVRGRGLRCLRNRAGRVDPAVEFVAVNVDVFTQGFGPEEDVNRHDRDGVTLHPIGRQVAGAVHYDVDQSSSPTSTWSLKPRFS